MAVAPPLLLSFQSRLLGLLVVCDDGGSNTGRLSGLKVQSTGTNNGNLPSRLSNTLHGSIRSMEC